MTDQVVEEVVAQDPQDDSSFEDGFNQAMGTEPTAEPVQEAPVQEEPPAESEAPAPEAPKEEPVEETVTLSNTEVKSLLARLDDLEKLKQSQDKAFGRIGSLQEVITKLQTAQTTGGEVEISDEDVADIAADFPEFGSKLKATLAKVLSKSRGPSAAVAPTFDPAPIVEQFETKLVETERKAEARILSVMHRDWREVVASEPFRLWLETQPEDYRTQINTSWNAEEIGGALDKFKDNVSKTVAAKQKRTSRLEAAVTPAGVRQPDTSALDEDAAFSAGFKSVRQR